LLSSVSEKKVSFHDEMLQRKLVNDSKGVSEKKFSSITTDSSQETDELGILTLFCVKF
jgi:hypothetical protein